MPLLINWIFLLVFWLLAVYSTSVYESFIMTANSNNFLEPTNYYYFQQQIKAIIYTIVIILLLRKFPVKILKNHKFAWAVMILTFIFQCLVFTKLWDSYNWARWWLNIPHIPSIQPSEFFKLAYVIFLASWLTRKKENMNSPQFLVTFIIINALLYFVFLLIPDFWTVLIIWATALVMVRYSWLKLKKTLSILWIWLCAWIFAWFSLALVDKKFDYITNRFKYFFTLDKEKIAEEREVTWWQTTQALIAIWGGWFFGNGYGNGLQKYSNLPEAYCDFIFAAFSEEIWFFWNLCLIILYIRMFRYVLKHLQKVQDPQLKLIWVWIISLIIIQTFVNMWVNVQIIPTTWITLPFISAGWSSLMVNCIELLLLYKIIKTENRLLPVR